MRKRISGAELEIMQCLWKVEQGVTFAELLAYFNETKKKGWCKQTLNTYLMRLNNRGFLTKDKKGSKTIYCPAVNETKYDQMCAEEILNESYEGRLFNFLAALSGSKNIGDTEEEELINLIKKRK